MSQSASIDLALFALRAVLGMVMLAHGWNHIWGGGKIDGTAGWFESLGMRPGRLHAWLASLTELGAGSMLVLGLFTPLAAAAVGGVMLVAWITNHAGNGFFIFRPGEGWEYVMTLTVVSLVVAVLGAGGWSVDAAANLPALNAWTGVWLFAGIAGGGTAALLAVFWRPAREEADG